MYIKASLVAALVSLTSASSLSVMNGYRTHSRTFASSKSADVTENSFCIPNHLPPYTPLCFLNANGGDFAENVCVPNPIPPFYPICFLSSLSMEQADTLASHLDDGVKSNICIPNPMFPFVPICFLNTLSMEQAHTLANDLNGRLEAISAFPGHPSASLAVK